MRRPIAVAAAASVLAAAAAVADDGAAGRTTAPRRFSADVTNPWYPLRPGTVLTYTGSKDGKSAREVLKVTRRTRIVDGVPCRVLDDRLYLAGRLAERTEDWYTQDDRGNVWYYGEQTAELDARGRVTSTEGSWRAGADGAKPGIFMPAHPAVGRSYRQEYYEGHAEDRFRIVRLHARVRVPYVSSSHAMLTEETTPLEPGVVDHKYYVRGIGTVREESVKGGSERLALVSRTTAG